ncbi:MAG TPA: hypothetical protein V6C86_23960 [Oculatellaceae cyanobacterium]
MTSVSNKNFRHKFSRDLLTVYLAVQCVVSLAVLAPAVAVAAPSKAKPAAAAGANAMALYQKGDYKSAAIAFYAKLKANPYDNESRYYLANCYAQMKNYKIALEEYQKVSNYAGSSNVAVYSRNAIDSINAMLHSADKKSTSSAKTPGDTKAGEDGEKVDVVAKKDPRIAAAEAAEKAKLDEGEKAAKKVMDEAQARIKQIKQEEDNAVQEISNNQQARMNNPEAASAILSEVKAPYEEQIKGILDPAKRRADEIKAQAKREAERAKQDALSRR